MSEGFYYIAFFIIGCFFGSFLNVVSDRIQSKESILFGRSHCVFCKTRLVLLDLVPVLSFLKLKGKCRYCAEKLSWYYPLSEFLTGSLFFGLAYFLKIPDFLDGGVLSWMYLVFMLVIICVYVVIILSDAKYLIIPDVVIIPAIIFSALYLIAAHAYTLVSLKNNLAKDEFGTYLLKGGYWDNRLSYAIRDVSSVFLSALLIGLFFWLLVVLTKKFLKKEGMGYGDIKLGILIGLVNGFPINILAVFLGFVLGAAYSLVLILSGRRTMKDTIPFGPFLITGSLICLVWGDQIINIYFGIL